LGVEGIMGGRDPPGGDGSTRGKKIEGSKKRIGKENKLRKKRKKATRLLQGGESENAAG